LKTIATTLSIGAGAPLGTEGPAVQVGAAFGSAAGQRFRLGVSHTRVLAAAGASGGIAAMYGVPLVAAVFSAELILGSATADALLPLTVSSIMAVLTRQFVLGSVWEFHLPASLRVSVVDYPIYLVLGLMCAIASIYFIKAIFMVQDLFGKLLTRGWARAALAGLIVGMVALLKPELLGTGKHVVQQLLLKPEMSMGLLVLFIVAKPLLCGLVVGGGASGGYFAPCLFMGAAAGVALNGLLSALWPELHVGSPTVYALAGMAGMLAGVMRAPLQAILITFELTQDYSTILPLMLTCVVSMKCAELFEPESVFTLSLVRRGEKFSKGRDAALLERLRVEDVMKESFLALPAGARIDEIDEILMRSENRTFPVTDGGGNLCGLLRLSRLMAVGRPRAGSERVTLVKDLLTTEKLFVEPRGTLLEALDMMQSWDVDCLPVCTPDSMGRAIVGICEEDAILERYDREQFIRMNA